MNIIVITGAGSGIGKEILKQIKQKEKNIDKIWAIDRTKQKLDDLEKEDELIKGLCIDLTNQTEIKKYSKLLSEEKDINIKLLVNCAGFGIFDHSENISLEDKLNMVDLNVKAYITMIDYSLPYMNKGSNIMNIASCAGFQPIPYINNYAATKAFVLSYSRALNQELKYRGIHVLAVTPFWTKTNFFNRAVVKDKKEITMEYALGGLANNIFASTYTYYIPNKDELINELEKVLDNKN